MLPIWSVIVSQQELPEELVVLGAGSTSSAVPSTTEKVAQGRSWAEKEQHLGGTAGRVMPPVWSNERAMISRKHDRFFFQNGGFFFGKQVEQSIRLIYKDVMHQMIQCDLFNP